MVGKTFSVQEVVYDKFSRFCKSHGINMSKQIELFMKAFIENSPQTKQEYLDKLDRIRKGKFVKVNSLTKKYG